MLRTPTAFWIAYTFSLFVVFLYLFFLEGDLFARRTWGEETKAKREMAGKNVGRLFQRVCQQSARGTLTSLNQGARQVVKQTAEKPAWLLAAAPFVFEAPNVSTSGPNDEEDDEEWEWVDDDDYDDEEDEERHNPRDMMKSSPTNEQWQNWSDNAERNPKYRQTVAEARKILQTPPPPPPRFPQFPEGFCVDKGQVPPVPPTLPSLKFAEFYDNENNSKKLPSSCPQARPPITEPVAECPPTHMKMTPRMPDLPFCDQPVPPPALPMPPPCSDLEPPPPPPPDPPKILSAIEQPPPPIPTPPPLSYELPTPPDVVKPQTIGKVPPLPCLPSKISGTGMARCEINDNNENAYRAVESVPNVPCVPSIPKMRGSANNDYGEGNNLPPPPPPISTTSMSTGSYWRDEMISTEPAKKKKKRRLRKKPKRISTEQDPTRIETGDPTPTVPQVEVEVVPETQPEIQEEEQFEILWSSRGRKGRQ